MKIIVELTHSSLGFVVHYNRVGAPCRIVAPSLNVTTLEDIQEVADALTMVGRLVRLAPIHDRNDR